MTGGQAFLVPIQILLIFLIKLATRICQSDFKKGFSCFNFFYLYRFRTFDAITINIILIFLCSE